MGCRTQIVTTLKSTRWPRTIVHSLRRCFTSSVKHERTTRKHFVDNCRAYQAMTTILSPLRSVNIVESHVACSLVRCPRTLNFAQTSDHRSRQLVAGAAAQVVADQTYRCQPISPRDTSGVKVTMVRFIGFVGWLGMSLLATCNQILVCALLTALSIPYSQTTWNSVPGFVCMFVRTIQNASSPSFLVRLSWYFNTMVPYLGEINLLHGFLIRALWRH